MAGPPRPRVLLVDDEPLVAKAMARLLAPDNDVTVAASVDAALEHVHAGSTYEVILCDLAMPRRSGADLYEELCACAPELAARMVVVTGGPTTGAARAFIERVALPRLDKPFTPEQLFEAVARVAAR